MFSDVVQYTDFAVGCVERHEGSCKGRTLLDVIAYCAGTFDSLPCAGSGGFFGDASSFHLAIEDCAKGLGGSVREVDEVHGESCRVVCDDVDAGARSGGSPQAGRSSESGVVRGVLQEKEKSVQGDGVDSDVIRGPNWARNQEWKKNKKAKKESRRIRKEKGCSRTSKNWRERSDTSVVESEDDVALKNSLKEKWRAQNELATLKAKRDYEAMKSTPIEDHIRSNRVRLQAAMERNMVSIEKTHAKLTATGNVPGDMTGFCATIIGSDSISPSSSASLQELRACQKKLLDFEVKVEVLTKALVDGGLKVPVVWGPGEFVGGDKEHHLHDIYTDNTENRAIFAECSVLGEEDAEDYGYPGKIKFNPA